MSVGQPLRRSNAAGRGMSYFNVPYALNGQDIHSLPDNLGKKPMDICLERKKNGGGPPPAPFFYSFLRRMATNIAMMITTATATSRRMSTSLSDPPW